MATPSKQRKFSKGKQGSSPSSTKKKVPIVTKSEGTVINIDQDSISSIYDEESRDSPTATQKTQVFKQPNFVHSSIGTSANKKARAWKNLKQIITAERALPWGPDDTTYGMIDAPPSFKPAVKYSDISGLAAAYTDPQTKLRYANTDEFSRIRMMPGDLITGCLALRKANSVV
ncbi:INO80 complex subunit C-like [Dreissena polymorpha]|uniref:INO80 complex subunit C-like n=1 Tax=Dreissena polymorpha TaxID=45954 RepID=UPI00226471A1|nr:INO80 complex subunit C-like [Dreissena polymorpha]XP_052248151.1 INO80 complex subunit C-like [Dreissena polymorpha]